MTIQNLKINKEEYKEQFRKRLKSFVLDLIVFVDSLPKDRSCFVIGDQLRSGTSVGANYFEARAASSKNDFINFFNHSLKSANESKFWLETLLDANKCDKGKATRLLSEITEIANIFGSSILTLKGKK